MEPGRRVLSRAEGSPPHASPGPHSRRGHLLHRQGPQRAQLCEHQRRGALHPAVVLRRPQREPPGRRAERFLVALALEPHPGGRLQAQPRPDTGEPPARAHHIRKVHAHALGHGQPPRRGRDGAMDGAARGRRSCALPPHLPSHRHYLRHRSRQRPGDSGRLSHLVPEPSVVVGERAAHFQTRAGDESVAVCDKRLAIIREL